MAKIKQARAALDPDGTDEIPPVDTSTPELRLAHLRSQVLSNEGVVRLVGSFL